jgi:hypothetical protein
VVKTTRSLTNAHTVRLAVPLILALLFCIPLYLLITMVACNRRYKKLTGTEFAGIFKIPLREKMLYSSPCYSEYNHMSTFWTSFLFMLVAFLIYQTSRYPAWFPIMVGTLSCISAIHHLRTYGQFHDDWLRVADISISTSLLCVLMYNGTIPVIILYGVPAFINVLAIGAATSTRAKSNLHCILHIVCASGLLAFVYSDNSLRIPSKTVDPEQLTNFV